MDVETGRRRSGVAVVGAILFLVGAMWIGQGAGYVGGSFMTGQAFWLYVGIATACAGLGLFAWGWRKT